MLTNNTVTKNLLELLIRNCFDSFGEISSSALLDSLKLLGFQYATIAGVSISIEDLRIPYVKETLLSSAKENVKEANIKLQKGLISETERFQILIDNWNFVTETLKNKIVYYYKNFDPLNNLYIMAFSGARGNISQVRQLVGMRGLMSDQEGNIIDLPIQKNFFEGLNSLDYLISSYGSRKGIVDTSLKTADSGYLTRRLIYLCQDLTIRDFDCKTANGLIILLNDKKIHPHLFGRFLITSKQKNSIKTNYNTIITHRLLKSLIKAKVSSVIIRSSLTCKLGDSICQKCYGWNLARREFISLGDTVGVIAAQSIGEPGTQMTMRTFHTGGVFTTEITSQIKADFSGKIFFYSKFNKTCVRTNKGDLILKNLNEIKAVLYNWTGKKKEFIIPKASLLYIKPFSFVKKDQLLAEIFTQFSLPKIKRVKAIKACFDGEIKYNKIILKSIKKEHSSPIKLNQKACTLWLNSGKFYSLPATAKINNLHNLLKNKAIAKFKLVTSLNGFYIFNFKFPLRFNYSNNFLIKFFPVLKNNQYLDAYTIVAKVYVFSLNNSKIYAIRVKKYLNTQVLFFVTEEDVWKCYSDEIDTKLPENGVNIKTFFNNNSSLILKNSGFLIKKDGFQIIIQKAIPYLISKRSILNCKRGDFFQKNQILANIITYTQQTQDIVQGLPRIEKLIEARHVNIKSFLFTKSSVLFTFNKRIPSSSKLHSFFNILSKSYKKVLFKKSSKFSKEKETKNILYLIENSLTSKILVSFQKKVWTLSIIPNSYKSEFSTLGYTFVNMYNDSFTTSTGSKYFLKFYCNLKNPDIVSLNINKVSANHLKEIKDITVLYYDTQNFKSSIVLKTKSDKLYLLEEYSLVKNINTTDISLLRFKKGQYFEAGDPLSEGMVDLHDLFNILICCSKQLDGDLKGFIKGLRKFQILLVNSIQDIYKSQGIKIDNRHVEIVARQLTSKCIIFNSGNTDLIKGEIVKCNMIYQLWYAIKLIQKEVKYKNIEIEPILLSATKHALSKGGFLTPAGFQETKRVLTKAAIEGKIDWIKGLKESVIIGRLISAGSSFLIYKNVLDKMYYTKTFSRNNLI